MVDIVNALFYEGSTVPPCQHGKCWSFTTLEEPWFLMKMDILEQYSWKYAELFGFHVGVIKTKKDIYSCNKLLKSLDICKISKKKFAEIWQMLSVCGQRETDLYKANLMRRKDIHNNSKMCARRSKLLRKRINSKLYYLKNKSRILNKRF